jgi:Flp pilus assembly protein CpaB
MIMRDTRAWIFLAIGLVLAGLTGFALYGLAQQAAPAGGSARGAGVTQTMDILVAKADLPVRVIITADAVMHKAYPLDLVPTGAFTNDADVIGQTTISPISRGQAIVQAQLSTAESDRSASLTVQKGMVMVAFPTTDPLTAAGLVHIGDKVDVLASVIAGTGENAKVSQTTIQNLEVLDILGPTTAQPQRATSLVFAVDHQVALVLKFLRDSQATIDLAIRSRNESEVSKTTSVDLGYVVSTYGIRR